MKRVLLSVLVIFSMHSTFTLGIDLPSDETMDDIVVCADNTECQRKTCFEVCLRLGEDPLECPLECITEAKNAPKRNLLRTCAF
jgi:hypothetical protein